VGALAFMVGCMRFGYNEQPAAPDLTPAAARSDAGSPRRMDAAVLGAGRQQQDASGPDAHVPVASKADAAPRDAQAGTMDSGAQASSDAAMPAPTDSGAMDSGRTDSGATDSGTMTTGPTDSGAIGGGPCAFTVTTNQYIGDPHFHGTLVLQNTGTTTWTMPSIGFDLPSLGYLCNDNNMLPGAGWALQSAAGHCAYTKTAPLLNIAPTAKLTFEYSSNYSKTSSANAVTNISVSGCP
jgi:hypothetical protein